MGRFGQRSWLGLCIGLAAAAHPGPGDAARAADAPAAEPAAESFPARAVPDFNVMLNDDGDWSFTSLDPQQSRRDLRAAIDALAGTPVKTYLRCVGLGSDVLYYPTRVASVIGWRKTTSPHEPYIAQVRAGMAAGIDPIRESGTRAKELGVRFFPSYRMNDAHFARTALEHPLTGEFWMQHHERLTMGNRLDFSHAEVRRFRLAIIFEIIERYQDLMDGLELDFNRHPSYFPPNQTRERAPLLTEMLVQVRRRLDEVAQRQKRPLWLIVRVNPNVESCAYSGIEVQEWIRRRLVDVVVPAQVYTLSYDMPIDELVKLARSVGCKVYPAIYPRTQLTWPLSRAPRAAHYAAAPSDLPSLPLLCGAADNLRYLGADGFELYNFRTPPGPLGYQAQRVLAHPAALTHAERIYAVTAGDQRANWEPPKQLPLTLESGQTKRVALLLGDHGAAHDDPPALYLLRLGLRDASPRDTLTIECNGRRLFQGPLAARLVAVAGSDPELKGYPPVAQAYLHFEIQDPTWWKCGQNCIELTAEPGEPGRQLQVVELQLGEFYDEAFPHRL